MQKAKDEGPAERCLVCGNNVLMSEMKQHLEVCRNAEQLEKEDKEHVHKVCIYNKIYYQSYHFISHDIITYRWRFVIHGAIDGYSRLPVFLNCSGNDGTKRTQSTD